MRISITGGLGFIGSALGSVLSEAGHDVRLVDIREGAATPEVNYLHGSLLNAEDCRATCEGMDAVVHGAAIHQVNEVAKNPLSSIELNVTGTLNLLRAAITAGIRRFIFLSSAKVIGESDGLPSAETELPQPLETYALSKLAGEHFCHILQPQSAMDIVIVRPYSVYGPKQEIDTGYIGMILSSLTTGEELHLPGQPEFVRDFVHIDDVTSLCLAALTATLPGVTTLNAGSGQSTSLRELVTVASEVSGVELEGRYFPPGPGTVERMLACTKYAESVLGYRPMYSLREGLTQTIEWFLQRGAELGQGVNR